MADRRYIVNGRSVRSIGAIPPKAKNAPRGFEGLSQFAVNPTRKVEWPSLDRPIKLIVPSGIGDLHWAFLRLRGLLKATGNNKHKPIIYVCSHDPARDRAGEFVRMLPWVEFGGFFDIRPENKHQISHDMMLRGVLHQNKFGTDAFYGVNTLMEMGVEMDNIFPEAGPTDWDYPLDLKTEPVQELLDQSVRHVAVIFYKAGFYKEWWDRVHPCLYINELADRLQPDQKIAILGAGWDNRESLDIVKLTKKSSKLINLSGKTTFQQVMHVIKTADGFFGHPSGLGILAQHIKRPTTLIWGPHWQWVKSFETLWANPDMRNSNRYLARSVDEDPAQVVQAFVEQMR
jgi:hypothetical protein